MHISCNSDRWLTKRHWAEMIKPVAKQQWISPSPNFFDMSYTFSCGVMVCSVLSIRITRNSKWNTDSLIRHEDTIILPYNTLTPVVMGSLDYCAKSRAYNPTDIQSVTSVPANERWRRMEEDGAARRSILTRWEEDRASHLSKRPSNFQHSL